MTARISMSGMVQYTPYSTFFKIFCSPGHNYMDWSLRGAGWTAVAPFARDSEFKTRDMSSF